MKKTFPIVMLPTEKASNLYIQNNKLCYDKTIVESVKDCGDQHLYIISDDEIKEGDCGYDKEKNEIIPILGNTNIVFELNKKGILLKVVATTDISLSPNKLYPMIQNNNTILPQIPESLIKDFIQAYNEGKPITEVDLEVEVKFVGYFEGTTMENWDKQIKTNPDNTVIVSQINEKKYSREELENYIELAWACCSATTYKEGDDIGADCRSWIQTHLK